MSNTQIEKEFAYEWHGPEQVIDTLATIADWKKEIKEYVLVDSIYDTVKNKLAGVSTGVRVRSKNGKTVMTAKKFLRRGPSGEGIFEERHIQLSEDTHPVDIHTDALGLNLPAMKLDRQLSFTNRRIEVNFTKYDSLVRIVNEDITYSNAYDVYREPLVEVEFEDVPDDLINAVRNEIETDYDLHVIYEGKTDRAVRFLTSSGMHIENLDKVEPVVMSAHGGRGNINMQFFHTAFSRFEGASEPKVTDFTNGNWEFFAHAVLPVGSEVKEHLHERTDEIYYILSGSATYMVDGEARIIVKGDCILTRKGSRHSLTDVKENLEFIATEILWG